MLKFKEEKKKREIAEKQAETGIGEGFGGFGGFGGEGEGEADEKDVSHSLNWHNYMLQQSPSSEPSTLSIDRTDIVEDKDIQQRKDSMSDLEKILINEKSLMLLYQQDSLIEDIEDLVAKFDDTVLHLRHEKSLLDVTVKITELKYEKRK